MTLRSRFFGVLSLVAAGALLLAVPEADVRATTLAQYQQAQAASLQSCEAKAQSNLNWFENSLHLPAYAIPCYLQGPGLPGNPKPAQQYPYSYTTLVYVYEAPQGWQLGSSQLYGSQFYFPPASTGSLLKNMGRGVQETCACTATGTGAVQMGDPINVANGNVSRTETDFVDPHGWLNVTRSYNSWALLAPGSLGNNWRSFIDRQLLFNSLNSSGVLVGPIAAMRPDGSAEEFTKNAATGLWTTDADVADTLTETDNASGAPAQYTLWNAAQQRSEVYDANGVLQSVRDAHGQGVSFSYSLEQVASHSTTFGVVAKVHTITDTWGRTLSFTYGSGPTAMAVASIALPDGGVVSYGYDSTGDLTSVTYPDGSKRQYLYNESALSGGQTLPGFLTGVVDEAGNRQDNYAYNVAAGTVATYSGGNGSNASAAGQINGVTVAVTGGATSSTVTYPLGLSTTVAFTAPNGSVRFAGVSGPCNPQCGQPWASQTMDANGNPQTNVDFNGRTTATTYSSAGLETQEIDGQGTSDQRTITTTWDTALRRPLTKTTANASGTVLSQEAWAYDATGQVLAHCLIDPTVPGVGGYACGSVPSGAGSAGGNAAVPAGVRQTTYQWCSGQSTGFTPTTQCPVPGLLLSVTGPRTDLTQMTTYTYYTSSSSTGCGTPGAACYRAGDLQSITDAAGHTITVVSYDADGRPTRTTDANGVTTDRTYNSRGWLLTTTVGGSTTTLTYTPYGQVATTTDPDGVVTTYGYDAAHRLTSVTDDVGNTITYTLDPAGHVTGRSVATSSGAVTSSSTNAFNTLGQLTAVVDGLNQTVFSAGGSGDYDGNGNLVQSTNALGIAQQRSYDALSRLKQTLDNYNGTDPNTANTSVQYGYDALDRLTSLTDPSGLITTYGFDGLSNPTSLTSPDTGATSRTFDAAGNALTVTDANGNIATSTYDALDRKTSTTYQNTAQNVTYTYDEGNTVTGCAQSSPVGRLTRIVEGSVTTVFCYDARGNVIEKEQTLTPTGGTGVTDTVGYAYTAADRLSAILYPSGTEVSYTRDVDGRVTSVGITPPSGSSVTAVSGVTYEPFGPITGYTLGNGQAVSRTFDANYRLTDLTSPAVNLHFARDALGDITALGSAPGANPALETYSYDPLQRLTAVTEANGSVLESVAYNPTGDRTSKTGMGLATGTYSYTPGTHHLVATGNAARSVDADGNTTAISSAGATYGFGYNARNRLAVAQLGGSTVGTYLDNALNERVQKTVGSTTTRFDYDEGAQLLGEYGVNQRDNVWLDGLPVANVDTVGNASTVSYVTADGLGTPRAVSDASGNLEWSNPYQGNAWNENAPVSATGYVENRGFPGQYFDAETGLFNNVNRYFDPSVGRYGEADPLGYGGGQNSLYLYAAGVPLNGVDPLGLQEDTGAEMAKEWMKDKAKDKIKDKVKEELENKCNSTFQGNCVSLCHCIQAVDIAACGGPSNISGTTKATHRVVACMSACSTNGTQTFTQEDEKEWGDEQ